MTIDGLTRMNPARRAEGRNCLPYKCLYKKTHPIT
jgi:hypothetical protein